MLKSSIQLESIRSRTGKKVKRVNIPLRRIKSILYLKIEVDIREIKFIVSSKDKLLVSHERRQKVCCTLKRLPKPVNSSILW